MSDRTDIAELLPAGLTDEEANFPDTKLRPDAKGTEEWLTTQNGGVKAIGVGGGGSSSSGGAGGDGIVIIRWVQ